LFRKGFFYQPTTRSFGVAELHRLELFDNHRGLAGLPWSRKARRFDPASMRPVDGNMRACR